MRSKFIGLASLLTVFAMMCVLRWWFAVYIIFSFAIVLTTVTRKRRYCHDICPVAFVQGVTYTPKGKTIPLKPETRKRLQWAILILFWGVFFGVTIIYGFQGRFPLLWHRLLLLTVGSLSTAVMLQEIYGKRVWCRYFCPLGKVLDRVIRVTRR